MDLHLRPARIREGAVGESGGFSEESAFLLNLSTDKAKAAEFFGERGEAVDGGVGVKGFAGDPGVIEGLGDRDTARGLDFEHFFDEVEGGVADTIPVGGGEVEEAAFDL